jgi:hypothetical protein
MPELTNTFQIAAPPDFAADKITHHHRHRKIAQI